MTSQEILEKLREEREESEDICYEFTSTETCKKLGLGRVEEVDSKGGEGEGENWYQVAHYLDHGVYIKLSGFYSSYNGVDFDGYDFEEVKPKEVIITVYESI